MSVNITPLGSGSRGNAYIINNANSSILLDCGIAIKKINILSGWKAIDICLVTHKHKDHCKALKDIVRNGIETYVPKDMKESFPEINVHVAIPRAGIQTKDWEIIPFELVHDVCCVGYQITDMISMDRVIYITDTLYCRYKFDNITHWMLECNYCKEVIDSNLNIPLRNRIVRNHMALNTVKELLVANDLSRTQEIWLLHLSNDNSNCVKIRKEISQATGKIVKIA